MKRPKKNSSERRPFRNDRAASVLKQKKSFLADSRKIKFIFTIFKIDFWLDMEGPRGSESDEVDDRSGSPGSQGEENEEHQSLMARSGGSGGSNKMTR